MTALLRVVLMALALALALAGAAPAAGHCKAVYGQGAVQVRVATGSPGELGLLAALSQPFLSQHQVSLCWRKAGSGASLRLLKEGQVDLALVHAPAAERQALAQGWAEQHTLIGGNEFFIVGPAADPARIAGSASAAQAYARIAKARAKFITRADNSGTHKRELALWRAAKIQPAGAWYVINRDFMLASLRRAAEIGAYFMTDSSTWYVGRARYGLKSLALLYKGDPVLLNTYHGLVRAGDASPSAALARQFLAFAASPAGQEIIRGFGAEKYGQALYLPAAGVARRPH
ncbi:MAG: substrate-binding domain-containing protein [Thermodesulfobacteriota bacterium]